MNQESESKESIKGRIVREATPYTGFPIIGNLKVGEIRKTGQKEYPVSLDYFRPTGKYAQLFTDVYGDKPNSVQIVFISDELTQSCYEEWEGRDKEGRKAGKSNGIVYELFNHEKQKYEPTEDKDVVAEYSTKYGVKWSVVLTLHFIIPKIKGVFGLWRFSTKANKSSVLAIRSTFDHILENVGTVMNVPFDLQVTKVKSQKPGSKSVFPVVNIVPNVSQDNLQQLAEYVASGQEFKKIGILTDDAIKKLTVSPETTGQRQLNAPLTIKNALSEIDKCESISELAGVFDSYSEFALQEDFKKAYEDKRVELVNAK